MAAALPGHHRALSKARLKGSRFNETQKRHLSGRSIASSLVASGTLTLAWTRKRGCFKTGPGFSRGKVWRQTTHCSFPRSQGPDRPLANRCLEQKDNDWSGLTGRPAPFDGAAGIRQASFDYRCAKGFRGS